MNTRPVLIDTDTGVDDALALFLALRSPEIEVVGITTVAGNVEVHRCTRNVHALMDRLKIVRKPPVVAGAARPIRATLLTAPEVHGPGGMGSLTTRKAPRISSGARQAARAIAHHVATYGPDLTIVAIGPLTNLAAAFRAYPSTMKRAGRIISMGGAFRIPGNTGPSAEFNYFVDPHAVEVVLDRAASIMVVPLDLTEQVVLSWTDVVRRTRRPSQRWLQRLLRGTMDFHRRTEGFHGAYLHDPIAVAEAIQPGLLSSVSASVSIVTREGPARGMTSMTPAGVRSRIRVADSVDPDRFFRMFERIWSRP